MGWACVGIVLILLIAGAIAWETILCIESDHYVEGE